MRSGHQEQLAAVTVGVSATTFARDMGCAFRRHFVILTVNVVVGHKRDH